MKAIKVKKGAAQKLLAFAALIILYIAFSIAKPAAFFTLDNNVSILLMTAVNGILAVGVTFVIITGGIDLSIGTSMALCAVMAGVSVTNWHLHPLIGVLVGILTGSLIGLVNGLTISKMKIPPFISTLGMMMVTSGLALVISGTKPVYFPSKTEMGGGFAFSDVAMGTLIPGIPNAVIVMFLVAIIASLLLSKTILGRYDFAIGSNEEATRLSGVNTDGWKTLIYVVCSSFSGLAGAIMASRLNSAQPALGSGYELDAIAAAVIGGTSLSGGEGSILGSIIGAFIISVLTQGLRIMSVPQEWQKVITGVIVVLAVYLDIVRRKKSK